MRRILISHCYDLFIWLTIKLYRKRIIIILIFTKIKFLFSSDLYWFSANVICQRAALSVFIATIFLKLLFRTRTSGFGVDCFKRFWIFHSSLMLFQDSSLFDTRQSWGRKNHSFRSSVWTFQRFRQRSSSLRI